VTTTIWRLRAELEGGKSFETVADQRDIAAFECEPFGVSLFNFMARPLTMLRYLAWHAGRRQKQHDVATWEAWGDVCLTVTDLDEGGEEAPEVDPGSPAASAGLSSN